MKLTYWQMAKLAILFKKTFNSIPQPMKLNPSWKTTLFGVGGLVSTLVVAGLTLLDGNPATNPDYAGLLPAVIASIGLLFAKDGNVSNAAHPMKTAAPV